MADVGASCPLFYPIDSRALEGLEYLPPFPLPSGVPGLRPPSGTSPPCPLGAWPTSQGDTLRLSILVTGGPKTVNFYGRTQGVTGDYVPFSRTVTGNSPTTPATATLPMPAGCLMNVDAIAVGGIGAATIYVLGELGHVEGGTFVPYAQVLSGLLTGYGVASSVATAGSGGGGGCCHSGLYEQRLFDEPYGVATQANITPAAGTLERVVSITFDGQMDATVISRALEYHVTLPGNRTVYDDQTPIEIVANAYRRLRAEAGRSVNVAVFEDYYRSMPADMFFGEEYAIQIAITNGQVGDEILQAVAVVEVITV